MKKIIFTLFILLFISAAFPVLAQDRIIKKNGDVVECKIREVGSEEVKYALPEYPEDVLFTILNEKIRKLVFESGQEIIIKQEISNPENYIDNKKNALKIDFLSPLTGNTTFAYERSIVPGQSIEAHLGIVGMGFDPNDYNARGAFIRFGYKFIKSPDFYLTRMRYAHILKGSYVKPELVFGHYSTLENSYDYWGRMQSRESVTSLALQVVIGKQWIYSNSFLMDYYFGVGYGLSSQEEYGYYYSHAGGEEEFPISFSMGLKIGLLF